MIRISVAFNLLLFALDLLMLTFPACFFSCSPSFCRRQRPRYSDGEFDSCAIYAHVTLLREGACISSISAASWVTIVDDWDDWFAG